MTGNGPYETAREARHAAHQAITPEGGSSILSSAQNRVLLGRALEAAGVECGRYDDRVTGWLAGFEDAICQVVAGWIARASQAASEIRVCRHCGEPISRCPSAHATVPEYPPCKGWRHAGLDSQPVIWHCCGGHGTNPVAEPAEEGEVHNGTT